MSKTITIQVTVTRVVHPRADESSASSARPRFTVLMTDRGKCVGMLPFRPADGAKLSLTGSYEAWHGERNFRFTRVSHNIPRDPRALLDYVCKVGKGLGPKTADKIWAAHGESWQANIDAFAPSTALAIRRTLDALGANKDRLDLTIYCIKIGAGASVAEKAWAAWGADAIATIENNPYSLASLPGIGFKTSDATRDHFKIAEKDARRAVAGIDYALTTAMEQSGNSVIPRDALYAAIKDINIPRAVASVALAKLVSSGRIVFADMDSVTTSTVVSDEGDLARYIATSNSANSSVNAPTRLPWPDGFTPDDAQEEAVFASIRTRGLTVINGGAGTGKTTIIRTLCKSLESLGCRVNLCAFAGKASARLREATDHPASTIHSMLGWTGEGFGFSCGSLRGDTVIVDEASMVPSSLIYEITKRDPDRLVLVGDQAQLQPVGIGSPFHDIIDNLPTLVHTLDVCHRNKEAVFASAIAIRNGETPHDAESRAEKFKVIRFKTPEDVHAYIIDRVKTGEVDFAEDLVLSPRNGEGEDPAPCTVKSVNADIQSIVNPHDNGEHFKINDRVMCVKNFAKLDIWNGTTGWISRIDTDGRPYFAPDGCDEVILLEKEQRANIVPAYCLTVHKSQGSQYRDVYIICLKRDHHALLDRAMLYTAVTRARRACYIICDDGIDRVIGAVRRRRTYLQMLLRGEC